MDENKEADYRKAIEHFKKNPYLTEVMCEIEKLHEKIKEGKK